MNQVSDADATADGSSISNFSDAIPVEIQRTVDNRSSPVTAARGTGIQITWSNHATVFIASTLLRSACPCATCREKAGELNHEKPLLVKKVNPFVIIQSAVEESLDLRLIWPVGNYALGIQWGDKHDSGIYSYELLRELSNKSAMADVTIR